MHTKRETGKIRKAALGASPPGKTRITIRLDDDVLSWFRGQVGAEGGAGYQTLIDLALRDYIAREPLDATLRRVIREELAQARGHSSPHAYDDLQPPLAQVADTDDEDMAYGVSSKRRGRGKPARKD